MGCHDACPYVPTHVEAWNIPDPAARPIEEVRAIRDAIEERVRDLVENKLDAIRSDRTAHELRLAQLLAALSEEFEDRHSAENIRACADAVLDTYDAAAVRSHIDTLALRQARECLRKETCALLVAQ